LEEIFPFLEVLERRMGRGGLRFGCRLHGDVYSRRSPARLAGLCSLTTNCFESIPKAFSKTLMKSPRSVLLPLASCLALLCWLTGCSSPQFYANYYLDPKPPKLTVGDLKPPASPQPVYLVFDMYQGGTAFAEA